MYGETFWSWVRKFIQIWLQFIMRSIIVWIPITATVTAISGLYFYGVCRFWLIYFPVCGLFFSMFYYEYTDEGLYFLSHGCGSMFIRRIKYFINANQRLNVFKSYICTN